MQNQNYTGIRKYYEYSKERFPLPGVIVYAGTLFFASYLFANILYGSGPFDPRRAIAGSLVFFLIMLHLRIFDEHKDYDADIKAHPERMLSRGAITLKELRKVLAAAVTAEAVISIYTGTYHLMLWGIIFAWSLLMFMEFFAPEFLGRHTSIYLISHQILVPLMFFYAVSLRYDSFQLSGDDIMITALFAAAVMCASITYEIARKTWSADREHEQADSYTRAWGIKTAVAVNQSVALCAALIMFYIFSTYGADMIHSIVSAALLVLFMVTGILFVKDPSAKKSKLVEAGGILFMLGLFVNSIVFFCRY